MTPITRTKNCRTPILLILLILAFAFNAGPAVSAATKEKEKKVKTISKTGKEKIKGSYLKILSPNGRENIRIGRDVTIQWTGRNINGHVRLVLYSGNRIIGNIADRLPAKPSKYVWKAGLFQGRPVENAKNYRVQIYSLADKRIEDFSDRAFALYKINEPKIEISWPRKDDTYNLGYPLPVKWKYLHAIGRPTKVTILLGKVGSSQYHPIAKRIDCRPGENDYRWHRIQEPVISHLLDTPADGGLKRADFKIAMFTDNQVRAESHIFTIRERPDYASPQPDFETQSSTLGPGEEPPPFGHDFELGPIYPSDFRIERISYGTGGGAAHLYDHYKMYVTLKLRNNSQARPGETVPVIPYLICKPYKYGFRESENRWVRSGYSESFEVGPFESLNPGEWTTCQIEFEFSLREAGEQDNFKHPISKYYINFELQNTEIYHDPDTSNNTTRTPQFVPER